MSIKACLFDLDGVLVDTARFHFLAWKSLAARLGFVFTGKQNERLKGVSRMESLQILLDIGGISASAEEKIQYADEKNKLYLKYIRTMTPRDTLPGAREFITSLKESGILIGLGSVSKNARTILRKTDLTGLFDAIVDGNVIKNAKPDPEVFELASRMLRTDPVDCVVFEDAVAGVQAAHRAGMKCIGVGSPVILKEADLVIRGFINLKLSDLTFKIH